MGDEQWLLIGELGARSGVSTPILRHHDRLGLLPLRRGESGYRRYGPAEIERLYATGPVR